MYSRRIILNSVLNMRELGGYRTRDGGITQYGRFLRSDNPYALSDEEKDSLLNYGITAAIDLRDKTETLRFPNLLSTLETVNYYHLPFFPLEEFNEMKLDYIEFTKNSLNIGNIFNTMVKHIDGVTIYNCTAGKDRTGIVTALLLMLADVPDCDIVADYQVSFTHLKPSIIKFLELYPDTPMHMMTSEPQLMEDFIDFIKSFADNERNGAWNFLIDSGVSNSDLDILRDKLLIQ